MKKFLVVLLLVAFPFMAEAANKAIQVEWLLSGVTQSNGNTLSSGRVCTYYAGTTTAKRTWTDRGKTSAATNPIVLDSAGKATIYADGLYKFKIISASNWAISPNCSTATGTTYDNLGFGLYDGYWEDISSYVSLTDAVTQIGSTPAVLLIDASTTILTANTSVPATLDLQFVNGGKIKTNGYTLTIAKMSNPGPKQIFDTSPSVSFTAVDIVYPEWFGGKADNATDSTIPFNIAVNLGVPVMLQAGTYLANAVHTTGYPVIQGSGMAKTYIKSYSATGYAWTESEVGSGWNTHLVMNDLSILGDASRNGFVYGDPSTYSTDINYAGRVEFNRVSFQGNVKGFHKPWGNIKTVFNDCLISGNSYGVYADESVAYPFHAGLMVFNNTSIMSNSLAGIYVNSVSSTGQIVLNECHVESNPGFGIFVYSYPVGYTPFRINNTWFESNATAGTVTINGTAYTPRDVYARNTAYAVMDGCMLVGTTVQLVNSSMLQTNCEYGVGSADVTDASSSLRQTNVNVSGTNFVHAPSSGAIVESVAATSGSFGDTYGSSWPIPPRQSIVGGYTKVHSKQYNGTAGVTTYSFDSSSATTVADGVIYDTCAELNVAATSVAYDVSGSISFTTGTWYVWSMDVKLTTTAKPASISFTGATAFNRDFSSLLVKDKWVTVGGVTQAPSTSTAFAPYIVGDPSSTVTLRMSAVQVVSFTKKQDAIAYFNAHLYRKE